MRLLYLVPLITLFCACGENDKKGVLLAKVGKVELYEVNLAHYFKGENYSQKDSVILLTSLREDWIKKQILVNEAKNQPDINSVAISFKADQYESELLAYELIKQKITERLDTIISDKEIKQYYNNHKDEFQLKDYLVKVLYLKVPEDAPGIDKIKNAYKLRKPEHIEEVQLFAKVYALNFYFDEDNWIYFDDLLKEVPLQDINKDKFIINKSNTRFQENGYYFFLNVLDYKLKNTASPLNFEKSKIKERILTTRTKELEETLKEEMITNAYANDKIKVYN